MAHHLVVVVRATRMSTSLTVPNQASLHEEVEAELQLHFAVEDVVVTNMVGYRMVGYRVVASRMAVDKQFSNPTMLFHHLLI